MTLKGHTLKSQSELARHICSGAPTFYHSSRTSTVIPYEVLEEAFGANPPEIADLGHIPGKMKIIDGVLELSGAVTWKEAKAFCQAQGFSIMTSPTEELASVLAGLATSCTGERCFGFGGMREQVLEIEYLDYRGEVQILSRERPLSAHPHFRDNAELLEQYGEDYAPYEQFKNAPFPRFLKEIDLMIGTEGQLGVITGAKLKLAAATNVHYIFLFLRPWQEDFSQHLEVFERVQKYRSKIFACEMIDRNSLEYLSLEERPCQNQDLVFLEIDASQFETVYQELLTTLSLPEESLVEIPMGKVRDLRMNVPRAIFEVNAKMGVTKKGTDVQVSPKQFEKLLHYYKSWSNSGVAYNLFGHFGDAHLHFNFMPTQTEEPQCQELLAQLYREVSAWGGSPFAEHGIGLLKQKFIKNYYGENQKLMFGHLKEKMDPHNQFFPGGYMNAGKA